MNVMYLENMAMVPDPVIRCRFSQQPLFRKRRLAHLVADSYLQRENVDDAMECASLATPYRNMGVTYSAGPKEYSGSKDLLRPRI